MKMFPTHDDSYSIASTALYLLLGDSKMPRGDYGAEAYAAKPSASAALPLLRMPEHVEEPVALQPQTMSLTEMSRSKDLCAALGEMSASVRQLMGVLRRHNCITALPDDCLHEYEDAMTQLADTVAKANALTYQTEQQSRDVLDALPAMVMLRQ